jgi:hypothetical protein
MNHYIYPLHIIWKAFLMVTVLPGLNLYLTIRYLPLMLPAFAPYMVEAIGYVLLLLDYVIC